MILARSLPIVKPVTSTPEPLRVTGRKASGCLPAIPLNTPASIVLSLKELEKIFQKTILQIAKLEEDAAAIERYFRQTVEE
ncbi:MAG: hypothetical protein ABL931_03405 [Usitatibacteraceae bacterium]